LTEAAGTTLKDGGPLVTEGRCEAADPVAVVDEELHAVARQKSNGRPNRYRELRTPVRRRGVRPGSTRTECPITVVAASARSAVRRYERQIPKIAMTITA
jgi:hypothetical protein